MDRQTDRQTDVQTDSAELNLASPSSASCCRGGKKIEVEEESCLRVEIIVLIIVPCFSFIFLFLRPDETFADNFSYFTGCLNYCPTLVLLFVTNRPEI